MSESPDPKDEIAQNSATAQPIPELSLGADARDDAPQLKHLAIPLGILVVLAIYLVATRQPKPPVVGDGDEPRVRIALIEAADRPIELTLEGSWVLEVADGESREVTDAGAVTVTASTAGFELTGGVALSVPRELLIRPARVTRGEPEQIFGMGKRRYRGRLRLKRLETGKLRAINSVGIEDYLAGVVGHEMPLRWTDEALKAQVIAARTYALMERKPGKDHDLKSDTRSQVYGGLMTKDARARELVNATRGLVVKHQGKMVVTYFHSTCGGDTVPANWVFPWVKTDNVTGPLSGATDCTCQPSKYYRWTKTVDVPGGVAKAVAVEHWPRGLYVKRVIITMPNDRKQVLTGWNARRKFKLRGYAFDAKLGKAGQQVVFSGRGWGHGVGLCQFGAEGFSKQGYTAPRILTHFYPETTVENLDY